MSGGFRYSFPTVVNEWRFCSSFPPPRPLMIGGFSIVLERVAVPHTFGRGKRPVNERVSATHLGNARISATHLKRRGQTAVSSQNEGEESIAGGVYKRNVKEAPLPFALTLAL